MRSSLVAAVLFASITLPLAAQAPAQPAAPAAATSALPPLVRPTDPNAWIIDVTHSELTFRIRHFVSKVRGQFNKWQGTVIADPTNLGAGSVEIAIDASSVDTNNERRDADLRSPNFFEVEKYPLITFKSTKVETKGDDITLAGDLTIKGITKPVVLKGTYNGLTKDARGAERAGFEASTKINRLDWGITWNRVAEGGGAMLGDDVEITIALEAFKPPKQG